MKEKLKKFMKEHERDILIGVAASALTTLAVVCYHADGLKVKNVCYHDDNEVEVINVYLKNGFQRSFHKKPK